MTVGCATDAIDHAGALIVIPTAWPHKLKAAAATTTESATTILGVVRPIIERLSYELALY